jgi:hypothetical protein
MNWTKVRGGRKIDYELFAKPITFETKGWQIVDNYRPPILSDAVYSLEVNLENWIKELKIA